MPKEPDNVVLKLLGEIRAKQDDHDKCFAKVEKKLEDLANRATYALGLSAKANIRHDTVQDKIDQIEKRLKKLEARA